MATTDVKGLLPEILAAAARIKGYIRHTPLERSVELSKRHKANVFIKLESEQLTGSFKIRGAFNKLLKLQEAGQLKQISHDAPVCVCASTGNHALACNEAFRKLGIKGRTYMPNTISPGKEALLRNIGADLVKHGEDPVDGETAARAAGEELSIPFISPYNDIDVVHGQGTIGVEIYSDLEGVDAVFVSVGGGGLIAGIAAYFKAVKPTVQIIGCSPRMSKVMHESVAEGKIIFEKSHPTLSDGTAGGLEPGALTFELCRDLVDQWVLVDEEEIRDAVYFMVEHQHKVVEGSAGVSVAAYQKTAELYKGQNVVLLACGANISIDILKSVLNGK